MDYRDAGKTYEQTSLEVPGAIPKKYYTSLEIDLLKFPELSKDIGEECVFVVKGVVTRKTLSAGEKCQYMEIRSIGVGTAEVSAEKESKNEADLALDRLAKLKTY